MGEELDWRTLFATGESPYFAMFRCGCMGVEFEKCKDLCAELRIPLREKDAQAWQDGNWNHRVRRPASVLNPLMRPGTEHLVPILESSLDDFEKWPQGWSGTSRRWFPCTDQNMPMQKWGYGPDYVPALHEREAAQALSPVGWVGQNLYAQPFIVIDIDGVGHGCTDDQVIAFGNRYRNLTETWENPRKPGSFHLYFETDRQIPISHFPYAKLDLMGNQKNAAVYTKDKVPNGLPRRVLDDGFWSDLKAYLRDRRAQREQTTHPAGFPDNCERREMP